MRPKFQPLSLMACLVLALSPFSMGSVDSMGTATTETIIGRLPQDAKLHPSSALNHPLAADSAGVGQLAVYFVFLIGLAAGGYFLVKRGLPVRLNRNSENRLHLRETKMLGNRQFLIVAEYEGSRMLLGVGPGKIEYLCPLDILDNSDLRATAGQGDVC